MGNGNTKRHNDMRGQACPRVRMVLADGVYSITVYTSVQ